METTELEAAQPSDRECFFVLSGVVPCQPEIAQSPAAQRIPGLNRLERLGHRASTQIPILRKFSGHLRDIFGHMGLTIYHDILGLRGRAAVPCKFSGQIISQSFHPARPEFLDSVGCFKIIIHTTGHNFYSNPFHKAAFLWSGVIVANPKLITDVKQQICVGQFLFIGSGKISSGLLCQNINLIFLF